VQKNIRVDLYSKPGCSLCEKAKAVLREVQQRIAFELVETDISTGPTLWETYRMDIPVVSIDGVRAFHHRVDPVRLEALLIAAGGMRVAESGGAG
jgi:glutaredoxin